MLSGLEKALGARAEALAGASSNAARVDKEAQKFGADARGLADANATAAQKVGLERDRAERKEKLQQRDNERKAKMKEKAERRESRRSELTQQKYEANQARVAVIAIQAQMRGARARTQTREMLAGVNKFELPPEEQQGKESRGSVVEVQEKSMAWAASAVVHVTKIQKLVRGFKARQFVRENFHFASMNSTPEDEPAENIVFGFNAKKRGYD